MEQCECFRLATNYHKDYCAGTKECEPCSCKGDPSKCDFYEDVRRKAVGKMNTAEMWLKAQEDGKWYESGDMLYQRDKGVVSSDDMTLYFNRYDGIGIYDVDEFLKHEWTEAFNLMTKSEAEAKFNIKIVG